MVTGDVVEREHTEEAALAEALKHGEAEMPGGRISIAREHVSPAPSSPFSTRELYKLDDALTFSSRETGLAFSVYLGELGEDSRGAADELHASIGEDSGHAVLIAVSPGERKVEIVTGEHAHTRLPDRSCKLAVMSMVASFKESDLVGGLVSGLRMLTEQAGPIHR